MKQCLMYALFIHKDARYLNLLDAFKGTKFMYSSDDDYAMM